MAGQYRPFVNGQMRPLPMPIVRENRVDHPDAVRNIPPTVEQPGSTGRSIFDTIPPGGLKNKLARQHGLSMLGQLQQIADKLPPELVELLNSPQAMSRPAATWRQASRKFAELTPNQNPRVVLARMLANAQRGTLQPPLQDLRLVS